MGPGCVLYPTSRIKDGIIHRMDSSLVGVEDTMTLFSPPVKHSLLANGKRPTPWGTGDMATLAGPRPGVCWSWGDTATTVVLIKLNY